MARLASALVAVDALNDRVADCPPDLVELLDPNDTEGLRLSVNAGTVSAGTVPNQIARQADAIVDARVPPGMTLAEVEQAVVDAIGDDAAIVVSTVKGWEPNWTDAANPLSQAVRSAGRAGARWSAHRCRSAARQ